MQTNDTPQILREIGRGGMGIVYEARLNGQPCAVKLLPSLQSDALARFDREIQVLRQLPKHPNIIGIHSWGRSHEGPWFAMDLISGGSLADAITSQGPLQPEELRKIALGIAKALGLLHERGILHRDLKPDNVLLNSDTPVLTDFGIARDLSLEAMTRTGVVLGTPRSIAPEQLAGNSPNPASDIWALGVLLFECLTGQPPFTASSPIELAAAIVNSPAPTLPDDIPSDLIALVSDLLQKNPDQRPSISEIIQRLENPSSTPLRRTTSNPRNLAAIIALSLLLTITAAISLTLKNSANSINKGTSATTIYRELRSQAHLLLAEGILKNLGYSELKSPIDSQASQQAHSKLEQIKALLRQSPLPEATDLQNLLSAIDAAFKNRPWPPSLAALETALNNPDISLREPAIELWKNLQIPGPELPQLTRALIAAHHHSYQEAVEALDLFDASPCPWADSAALQKQFLEDWAFASIPSPTDRPKPWQLLLERSPKAEDFQRWNKRAESILQSLEAKPGLNFYLGWEDLCLQSPELRRPLAPAPIHRARGELGGAEPRADREFEQFSHFMASAEVGGSSVIALGTRLLLSRARVIRERKDHWSLAERRMIYDMLVINARHGVFLADSRFLSMIEPETIIESYLRGQPPLSEQVARSNPNIVLDHAFLAYQRLERLIGPRSTFSENLWIQCITDLNKAIQFIPLACATPIPESNLRGAIISGLADGLRELTPSARARTWSNLGLDNLTATLNWLSDHLKKSADTLHFFPDSLYFSYADILASSLQPEAQTASERLCLAQEFERACKLAIDWSVVRMQYPKMTGRYADLGSPSHYVISHSSNNTAIDRMIRLALIAASASEQPKKLILDFSADLEALLQGQPYESQSLTILNGLACATGARPKDNSAINSALEITRLARRSRRERSQYEESDILFREALQKIEDTLSDSISKSN